ncbi:MAG: TonB-dependent receptor [Tannerella sp.]|jgi:outer membrane receptor protein involved in Fe transport|nr:TonB-dependent receptor [Tannerella sp.]
MKNKLVMLILTLASSLPVCGQIIKGHIYDAATREPLPGATIAYDVKGTQGTIADANGAYELKLPAGGQYLVFRYMGYDDVRMPIVIAKDQTMTQDVYMKEATKLLDDVVVTAGRYEQKLSDITVSMELLKSDAIKRQSPTDMTAALSTLPGVDVVDKQPSIRGGGGWTYGVGARSQVLIDGLSALNPQNGEINWNLIPMENVEQVEVIKGASSVLYGSSALNGIINVRTARPGLVPKTNISLYTGIYGDPAQSSYQWSDKSFWSSGKYAVEPLLRKSIFSGLRNPMYEGLELSHTQRVGDFDLSGGLNLYTDEGYREQGFNKRFRVGGNITYHQPMHDGKLMNYGANVNFLSNEYGDFFIWRSPAEVYRPSAFANMGRQENMVRVEPIFNYTNPNNNTSHKIKSRVLYSNSAIGSPTQTSSILDILGNMGTDAQVLQTMAGGDLSVLNPLIQGVGKFLLSNDLNSLINGAQTSLKQIFPNAGTADYCDLIAWVMKNGLPKDIGALANGKLPSDLIPWLSDALNNKQAPVKKLDHSTNYYADYQFNKKWKGIDGAITAGLTYEHTNNFSGSMDESHQSDNVGMYAQYNQRLWKKLNISAGLRTEYYRVDAHYREAESNVFGLNVPFKPVIRAGLNYELAPYSHFRASFGQGYRYPSIIEKYLYQDIGGIAVYPNHDLKAERGYNAEAGFMQGYKIGNLMGMLDVDGFYTQYRDMIEFQIGLFDQSDLTMINSLPQAISMLMKGNSFGIGAQFHNVSKAVIYGAEISTSGMYKFNPSARLTYNIGYTYTEPLDADYKARNAVENQYTDPLQMKEKSNNSKYLKYRPKHSFKSTLDFEWKRLTLGTNIDWKSKILAVDYIMLDERPKASPDLMDYVRTLLFGSVNGETLASYWTKHNTDYATVDFRFGVKATKAVGFQFMINNLFNKEYSYRPMAVGAPRTFVVKMNINL